MRPEEMRAEAADRTDYPTTGFAQGANLQDRILALAAHHISQPGHLGFPARRTNVPVLSIVTTPGINTTGYLYPLLSTFTRGVDAIVEMSTGTITAGAPSSGQSPRRAYAN